MIGNEAWKLSWISVLKELVCYGIRRNSRIVDF